VNFLGIGGLEVLVIALVAFLVLGPKRMAEAGKTAAKVLSQLRKQRDELTSALLEEPGKETPGDDFPGYPGGASLREPVGRPPAPASGDPSEAGPEQDPANRAAGPADKSGTDGPAATHGN
jgi:Sec-independent protein translocase protein TatA